MIFGAHISVAGGYPKALDYAESVGCECAQVFAKSPRQWAGPPVDVDAAQDFVRLRADRGFGPVFTHTAYLLNLSTDDDALRERSAIALADEIVRAAFIAATGVVTHIGNDPAGDESAAAARAGAAIERAFALAAEHAGDVRLLLENTAGAGRTFGATCGQIGACIQASGVAADRVGMCLDTCHGWAQGMALDHDAGWTEVLGEIDSCMGLDRLGLVHANDCLYQRGSHKDRHAWIGDGHIGMDGFIAMVCRPELSRVPAITEMPGDKPVKDETNLERLKAMRSECAGSR